MRSIEKLLATPAFRFCSSLCTISHFGRGRFGYDTKIMRQIIRLRKMKPDERSEQETILDTYKAALGMG